MALLALVERTEGVHYTTLITTLTDPATADAALAQLLRHAATLDPDQSADVDVEGQLARWRPVIAAIVTAATTGHTPPELTELLDQLGTSSDWAHLVAAIRRVLAGDRDRPTLLAGLDPIGTAILTTILDRHDRPP